MALKKLARRLVRKKVKKFAFVGLLLGAMLVCTIIWYRMQYMNYIILGIAEFMLVGVLAAGVFVLALVSEVRDCVGRFIIGSVYEVLL